MALSFKDMETDALARQVARLTGETLTQAVRTSLAERLRREQLKRGHKPLDQARIDSLLDQFAALPLLDPRTDEDILGYDESGLPT